MDIIRYRHNNMALKKKSFSKCSRQKPEVPISIIKADLADMFSQYPSVPVNEYRLAYHTPCPKPSGWAFLPQLPFPIQYSSFLPPLYYPGSPPPLTWPGWRSYRQVRIKLMNP